MDAYRGRSSRSSRAKRKRACLYCRPDQGADQGEGRQISKDSLIFLDRVLIDAQGMQVAPAELEAHILSHPSVADCAVIPVPDDAAGERPKAFIVKSPFVGVEEGDHKIKQEISKYIRDHKARHKWLDGGIEFIDVIPKSTSGKILRRMLRDKEKETRRKRGARL